jgi:hypothetical protein
MGYGMLVIGVLHMSMMKDTGSRQLQQIVIDPLQNSKSYFRVHTNFNSIMFILINYVLKLCITSRGVNTFKHSHDPQV